MTTPARLTEGPTAEHRTVGRVVAILELVVASDTTGVRLNDLATLLNAPKSSLHALAKGLIATGYLREHDGRYLVGPAISSLISAGSTTASFAYHHILEALAARWGETAMLAKLVGESIVYVDSVQPDTFIRASPPLNKRLALWPRSSGKAFLAYMDHKKTETYLRRHHSLRADVVRAELDRTRELGFGLSMGESFAGHVAISVPIIRRGSATAAIAIAGPRPRMEDRISEIAGSIQELVDSLPQ